ncbi:MAG: CAP domain-containing protein [Pseudomonadota bacterium]
MPADVVALLDEDVAAAPPGPGGGGIAGTILALVNAERASGGQCGGNARSAVAPLALDPALSKAAAVHAHDMASNNFFSHTGSDKSNPFKRIAAAGFSGGPQGENIAAGYPSAASVVAGWMSSPDHCNNIMNAGFDFLGADHAFDASSAYGHYWVQTFGGS